MPRVQVWVELSEEHLRDCESEAQRRGVAVESLLEQTVNYLLKEVERDEKEGTDYPIVPS